MLLGAKSRSLNSAKRKIVPAENRLGTGFAVCRSCVTPGAVGGSLPAPLPTLASASVQGETRPELIDIRIVMEIAKWNFQ
ncbi:UNVERIFIED_CONTAM: hypothetical protein K2H54_001260 [Gekko kuhli]